MAAGDRRAVAGGSSFTMDAYTVGVACRPWVRLGDKGAKARRTTALRGAREAPNATKSVSPLTARKSLFARWRASARPNGASRPLASGLCRRSARFDYSARSPAKGIITELTEEPST